MLESEGIHRLCSRKLRPLPGPLIFKPYAADMAERAASLSLDAVLEIATGTGVVTRVGSKTVGFS